MKNIIVITPPTEIDIEMEMQWIPRLFEAGLEILHVRKPHFIGVELWNYIERIPHIYHNRVVVHSDYELAHEFSLKGIHLTEKSRIKHPLLHWKAEYHGKTISASFHELEDLVFDEHGYDYMFLSPVFDSISKKGYQSHFDAEELQAYLQEIHNKYQKNRPLLYALGGVCVDNVSVAKVMGFDGVAVLGGIWESNDPVMTFKKLQKAWDDVEYEE